jgi:hypothetical protein
MGAGSEAQELYQFAVASDGSIVMQAQRDVNVLHVAADAGLVLERVRTGTVVVTSRQAVGWGAVCTVPLDVLSADEAIDMLTRIVCAEWPEADLAGAGALCAEVGWLPLAVEQGRRLPGPDPDHPGRVAGPVGPLSGADVHRDCGRRGRGADDGAGLARDPGPPGPTALGMPIIASPR